MNNFRLNMIIITVAIPDLFNYLIDFFILYKYVK